MNASSGIGCVTPLLIRQSFNKQGGKLYTVGYEQRSSWLALAASAKTVYAQRALQQATVRVVWATD